MRTIPEEETIRAIRCVIDDVPLEAQVENGKFIPFVVIHKAEAIWTIACLAKEGRTFRPIA